MALGQPHPALLPEVDPRSIPHIESSPMTDLSIDLQDTVSSLQCTAPSSPSTACSHTRDLSNIESSSIGPRPLKEFSFKDACSSISCTASLLWKYHSYSSPTAHSRHSTGIAWKLRINTAWKIQEMHLHSVSFFTKGYPKHLLLSILNISLSFTLLFLSP